MLSYAITFLLVATSATALEREGHHPSAIETVTFLDILPINSTSSPVSSIADSEVFGWKPCDGMEERGTVLSFRITCCTPSDRLCVAPVEVYNDVELDGIPSRPISHLGRRIRITRNEREGPVTFQDVPYRNTTVEEGSLYRFFGRGKPTQPYKGQVLNLQYSYYDVDTGEDEFCVQGLYKIV